MNNGQSYSANAGYSKRDRKWVDDQTTAIGGNSVNVIVGNNTNLVGAVIANQREELVTKITQLAEKYAPNNEWFIQTMMI